MWRPDVIAPRRKFARRTDGEGYASMALGLRRSDEIAVHEEIALAAAYRVTRHSGKNFHKRDAGGVGTSAGPTKRDVLPVCRQFSLMDEEESVRQACGTVEAEREMHLEENRGKCDHQVRDAPMPKVRAKAAAKGLRIEAE